MTAHPSLDAIRAALDAAPNPPVVALLTSAHYQQLVRQLPATPNPGPYERLNGIDLLTPRGLRRSILVYADGTTQPLDTL